ncbi:hypothetical protein [Neobacillus niacini]|uniref:hypothetical protein n=1 Tax=Neobacillus niacini TaxID=86668 RepID=UPI000AF63705
MQIREMEERNNQTMEQIIKHSLESFNLDILGTAYFNPQLSNIAQFFKEQLNAKYWVAVNELDEVVGGVGIAPFGQTTGGVSCKGCIFDPNLKVWACQRN